MHAIQLIFAEVNIMKCLCLLSLLFCLTISGTFAQKASPKNATTKQLYSFFDRTWEESLKDDPGFASFLGDKRYNDRWGDNSLAAFADRQRRRLADLAALKKINRAQLSASDQLNYDLFKHELEENIER